MRTTRLIILLAATLLARNAAAATLNIGLSDDPDLLDPARSISYTDRIVFASVCDKLIDVSSDGAFVPQLATRWEWSPDGRALTLHLRDGVKFQDGTTMDADAVKTNLERYRNAPESARKSELKPVTAIVVVDPHTIRLTLSAPSAPLVALLAESLGHDHVAHGAGGGGRQYRPAPGLRRAVRLRQTASRRTTSPSTASPITGTRNRSASTRSSSARSRTPRPGWSTCNPANCR